MFNILLLITCFSLQIAIPGSCSRLQFNHENFTETTSDIIYQQNSSAINSTAWLLPELKYPSLATSPSNAYTKRWYGWMVYKDGIPFFNFTTQKAKSFNTSFTFKLITQPHKQSPSMVFLISKYRDSPANSLSDPFFGFTEDSKISPTQNPFFFVGFSTAKLNSTDVSNSRVGIGISSNNFVSSIDTTNNSRLYYPQLYLHNNSVFKAWVSYDASSLLTKLWMTKLGGNPPNFVSNYSAYLNPPDESVLPSILQYKFDLSSTFNIQKNMYFGFSAATRLDSGMHGAAIYNWYFSISDESDDHATSWFTKVRLAIIIPCIVVTSAIVAACVVFFYRNYRRKSRRRGFLLESTDSFPSAVNQLPRYSYHALHLSTNKFNDRNLVGEGGYSKVYKGTLPDGSEVAIKRLKDGGRKEAEFTSELTMINAIRHRNLLQLQGWSYSEENGEALLVYKFMTNGSLDGHLSGEKRLKLDGGTRLRILSGVSAALEYLHFGLGDCVLHRDVKAANVLLTEDFEPILGDFGLARLIKHNESVTATMVGTIGYVAPELIMQGKVTDKADVYSFGVLMLVVACGRRVIVKDPIPGQHVHIVEHVSQLWKTDCLDQALDPIILQGSVSDVNSDVDVSEVKNHWTSILHLALMCCQRDPEARPNMRYVHQEINTILNPSVPPANAMTADSTAPYLGHELFSTSNSKSQSTSLDNSTQYTGGPR